MANTPYHNHLHFAGLRALAAELPKTRVAQIRSIWPLISAALHRGHKLTAINDRLREDGFEIQYRTLNRYVNRLRFEDTASDTANEITKPFRSVRKRRPDSVEPTAILTPTAPALTSNNELRKQRDPMAVARDYLSGGTKVRGFQFKEGAPDMSKLV